MPFQFDQDTLDSGVLVLTLSGAMTMGTYLKQFEWKVEELAKEQHQRIVMDMAQVSYLDSSAIGVLVGCNGLLLSSGGQLRLAGVTERVNTIFKMTGVDGLLLSSSTRDEAVHDLTQDTRGSNA